MHCVSRDSTTKIIKANRKNLIYSFCMKRRFYRAKTLNTALIDKRVNSPICPTKTSLQR
jgi:hypothetical protein